MTGRAQVGFEVPSNSQKQESCPQLSPTQGQEQPRGEKRPRLPEEEGPLATGSHWNRGATGIVGRTSRCCPRSAARGLLSVV